MNVRIGMYLVGLGVLLCCGLCNATHAATQKIAMEEFSVPALDPGITLYVRNKHPVGLRSVPPKKILLFVHGATWPSESTFDLKLNGLSWMDYVAQRGYDVYLVDIRGYGRSTHPREMELPPEQNEPLVHTATAVRDLGTAVDFVLRRRGASQLDLLGWSWGTSIVGSYTAQHNDKVFKLVLYAPLWVGKLPPSVLGGTARLGAYRTVTRDAARSSWLAGVPESKRSELLPVGWFEAFAEATFPAARDASGQQVLEVPNGVLADNREFWNAGKPLYDPADIRVPTFLAHAEWDAVLPSDLLYAYFERLTNVPYKRYVQIGEGTHQVMMEKNRMQLFETVQQFLDENLKAGD